MTLVIHHPELKPFIEQPWTLQSLDELVQLLSDRGTLNFRPLETGLFPAADADSYTGYHNVWVRDNIHLAHGFLAVGEKETAANVIHGLTKFFLTQQPKIDKIISGDLDPSDHMNRPHIRFDGASLSECDEKWAHGQNDALGYYLWLTSLMVTQHDLKLNAEELQLLARFPKYFHAIQYWQDKDSGHWEELKKVEMSSVGTVVRGLQAWETLLKVPQELPGLTGGERETLLHECDELLSHGMQRLAKTLPWECKSDNEKEQRQHDAALLFLIAPLGLLDANDAQAKTILDGILKHLAGDIGIRRYLGDSYWCADYKLKFDEESRTSDFSDDIGKRDALLNEGQEAQWCIFDPIVSVIYGQRYLQTSSEADLTTQMYHLDRSVAQITGPDRDWPEFRCPESYYLAQGEWIPNDVNPLLWTQANLKWAIHQAKLSLEKFSQ
jgi:phosphorylase kinase alpha/beta subunit